jgi:hypothetical protein
MEHNKSAMVAIYQLVNSTDNACLMYGQCINEATHSHIKTNLKPHYTTLLWVDVGLMYK